MPCRLHCSILFSYSLSNSGHRSLVSAPSPPPFSLNFWIRAQLGFVSNMFAYSAGLGHSGKRYFKGSDSSLELIMIMSDNLILALDGPDWNLLARCGIFPIRESAKTGASRFREPKHPTGFPHFAGSPTGSCTGCGSSALRLYYYSSFIPILHTSGCITEVTALCPSACQALKFQIPILSRRLGINSLSP